MPFAVFFDFEKEDRQKRLGAETTFVSKLDGDYLGEECVNYKAYKKYAKDLSSRRKIILGKMRCFLRDTALVRGATSP